MSSATTAGSTAVRIEVARTRSGSAAARRVRVARMTWIFIAIAIGVLLGLALVVFYNRLVRLRNRVDNAWAQVDVQLKRRYDLIPNLVETVKGYAAHESGTLEKVIQARNMAMSSSGPAEQAQNENVLSGALKSLF